MDTTNQTDDSRLFMHNAFWQEGQVAITFHSNIPLYTIQRDVPVFTDKAVIIHSLKLSEIGAFLYQKGYQLLPFTDKDILQLPQEPQVDTLSTEDLYNLNGKYLFRAPKDDGTTVLTFFRFLALHDQSSATANPAGEMGATTMNAKQESGPGDQKDEGGDGVMPVKGPISNVTKIVNVLNENNEEFRAEKSYVLGATPNWYAGATGNGNPDTPRAQGCPLTPPMPVPNNVLCPTDPGLFPIELPELPHDWQAMTGDGVTVIILDTLPKAGEIARAAEGAEQRNMLLLDVANNVTFHHNKLADSLDGPSRQRPITGKDIYGRIVGFHMPDHGLFSAGIIRDLAPNASVECIRILNDFCVGDMAMLAKTMEHIHERMLPVNPRTGLKGDLHEKPVVINMSLVVSPPDGDIVSQSFDPAFIAQVRASLRGPIQSLADLGAVMVASAGNEADPRNNVMNPDGIRPGPLYPAAFADSPDNIDAVIPVGAINGHGKAASYSNYPGPRGIGTYGGEIPTPIPPTPPGCMTGATAIDATIGIYTALSYPALSYTDCETSYHEPNANAWAYWSGTSFATPIISALAARAFELRLEQGSNASIADMLQSAATGNASWDRLPTPPTSIPGPMFSSGTVPCCRVRQRS